MMKIQKKLGGDLGWIDPNNFSIPEIGLAINYIKVGECSPPVNSTLRLSFNMG